ncbi:MAG TPA: hypothetical protein VJU18_02330, partial [Vicinamibacteria bacterium]|nr:hypothetical protein [Vicinamibacteria bacterium]
MAQAAPTISITSPTPGQPVYDVRPTIVVTYSTSDPEVPLNLDSLTVSVNNLNWTAKFSKTDTSATYAISAEDALVAGMLTIEASISDDAGASASATQQYEVFPTLQAVNPSAGRENDEVTVTGLGLDPAPERSVLRFRSPFDANGVDAPFTAVDRASNQGMVRVPGDAVTGPVRLVVNGKPSRETIAFVVPSLIPCGGGVWASMPDGGWLLRQGYWGDPDPHCPPLPNPQEPLVGAIIRIGPDGYGTLLGWSHGLPNEGYVYVEPLIDGNDVALFNIVRPTRYATAMNLEVVHHGVVTRLGVADLPSNGWAYGAFDPKGNLYVAHHTADARLVLKYVSKEQLAAGGSVVPAVVAADLDPVPPETNPQGQPRPAGAFGGMLLSCDGFAYLPFAYNNHRPPAYENYRIRKLALPLAAVVADVEVQDRVLEGVALSCHTNELWGSAMPAPWTTSPPNSDTEYWRAETTSTSIGTPERVEFLLNSGGKRVIVGPRGELYTWYQPGLQGNMIRLRTRVEPCDLGGGVFDARSICREREIEVLPSTTRWKPQKDTTKSIEVYFRGPKGLKPATTLEITDPNGVVLSNQ